MTATNEMEMLCELDGCTWSEWFPIEQGNIPKGTQMSYCKMCETTRFMVPKQDQVQRPSAEIRKRFYRSNRKG